MRRKREVQEFRRGRHRSSIIGLIPRRNVAPRARLGFSENLVGEIRSDRNAIFLALVRFDH
jgi:hypothetical protein